MKILVQPHAMEIGGSQLNAVELAAALQDRGHQVTVISKPGPLVDMVHDLSLDHVELPVSSRILSPSTLRGFSKLVSQRQYDVVHGYEWPPAMAFYFGPGVFQRIPAVCTVLSMAVAPFLPRRMPLIVGTEDIRDRALEAGFKKVRLLEPPVNTDTNHPGIESESFRIRFGLDPAKVLIVVVGRLARELKLEGLLCACDAVGELAASGFPIQMAVVGDGPVRNLVASRAEKANAIAGCPSVVLTGSLSDPRPAYAAADILLGMGGSALRGMAFAKPLIVQGERGFWRRCCPDTVSGFFNSGWYGVGDLPFSDAVHPASVARLRNELEPLLSDLELRKTLGEFGRQLVINRFSLRNAAAFLEEVYSDAIEEGAPFYPIDATRSVVGAIAHTLRRRFQRLSGVAIAEDFNALSVKK